MRLICPSCGAQYEVDDSVIPEAGRDVQCSNCGHAWFQMSAIQLKVQAEREAAPDEAPEEAVAWTENEETPQTDEAINETSAHSEAVSGGAVSEHEDAQEAQDAVPMDAAADETVEEEPVAATESEPELDAQPAAEVAPEPEWRSRRKTLDDAVVNVLREEADRERRVRETEGGSMETQPDLGLAAVTAVAPVVAAETVHDDENESPEVFSEDEDDAIVSRASRRELLPDIEEINSTLRATSDRGGEAASVDAPETLRRRRSGFRMGFSTSILIAALLLLLYVMAPTIAEKVPAAASAMGVYVATVDGARSWLDATLRGLTASMKGDGG
jgi:predicted Zn finger-like uncharacterized protein